FPSMNIGDIVNRISGWSEQSPVLMPPVSRFAGNTIGYIVPYWYIGALTAAKQPTTAVEIGTYLGASALTMALNSPEDCRIITVDLPEDSEEDTGTLSQGDKNLVANAKNRVGQAFLGHPLSKKITQVRTNSSTLDLQKYVTRPVDF
ncbi:MAG: hypothetical protein WA476_05440, partial [Acidobacteriaceae bacterium]